MQEKAYDIRCSKAVFDVVKTDARFLGLLILARFVNALRFSQKAGIDGHKSTGYAGARSTVNSFLFSASILYEGFILVEKLATHFRDLDSFKIGFGVLLKDKKVSSIRKSVLGRMRNKFVFHFDQDVAKEALDDLDLPEYKFASGVGKAAGEMVFVLADEAVINYLLQPAPGESNEIQKWGQIFILDN